MNVSAFPDSVVKVQFVRFTFPDAVQVPAPVVMVFPVPVEQVRSPVRFTVGSFAAPVRFTDPLPDSATSKVDWNVTVPAESVTERLKVPELSIFTAPP